MNDAWPAMTLGSVCADGGAVQTGPFGSQLHAGDYVDDGVPVVMPVNIGDGRIMGEGIARITDTDAERLSRHRVRPGDIIYSRRGDITRRALVRDEQAGWLCGTGCLLVRPGRSVSPEWLAYWLGAPWTHEWLRRHAVGATMPNLNTSILSALPVALPPIDVQRRVAGVLGTFDDLIDTNRELIDRLVEQADRVAALHVTAGESTRTTFGDVAGVFGGGTPSTKEPAYWNGGVPWATPTDMTALPSPYLRTTTRMITQAGLDACSSSLYPAGSILMTSRATIGSFALSQVPVAVNQGFIVVTPQNEDDRFFLFHEMRRRVPDFIANANGSTFLELSRGRFKALELDLPSPEVRHALATAVRPLHEAAVELETEITDLTNTRDELLPLLMSGRVTVDEAWEAVPG